MEKITVLSNAIINLHTRVKNNGGLRIFTGNDIKDIKKIILFIQNNYEIEKEDLVINELVEDIVMTIEDYFLKITIILIKIENSIDDEEEYSYYIKNEMQNILNILYVIFNRSTLLARHIVKKL